MTQRIDSWGKVKNFCHAGLRGFCEGLGTVLCGGAIFQEVFAFVRGKGFHARPIHEQSLYKVGSFIKKMAHHHFPCNPALEKHLLLNHLPRLAGEMLPYLVAATQFEFLGVASAMGKLILGVAGALSVAGASHEAALTAGADRRHARAAAWAGVPFGMFFSFIGLTGSMVGKVVQKTAGKFLGVAAPGVIAMATEVLFDEGLRGSLENIGKHVAALTYEHDAIVPRRVHVPKHLPKLSRDEAQPFACAPSEALPSLLQAIQDKAARESHAREVTAAWTIPKVREGAQFTTMPLRSISYGIAG